jgi:hypothetical protein
MISPRQTLASPRLYDKFVKKPLNHQFGFVTRKTRGRPFGEPSKMIRFLPS